MPQSMSTAGGPCIATTGKRQLPPVPWIFYLAVAAPNVLDAYLTVRGMQAGIPEANPMMRLAMEHGGAWSLWLVKVAGVALLVSLAEACRIGCSRVPTTMLVAVSALFMMAVLNNLTWVCN